MAFAYTVFLNSASATQPIVQNLHHTKKAERIPRDTYLEVAETTWLVFVCFNAPWSLLDSAVSVLAIQAKGEFHVGGQDLDIVTFALFPQCTSPGCRFIMHSSSIHPSSPLEVRVLL